MKQKKSGYRKPEVKSRKIKVNFFLARNRFESEDILLAALIS